MSRGAYDTFMKRDNARHGIRKLECYLSVAGMNWWKESKNCSHLFYIIKWVNTEEFRAIKCFHQAQGKGSIDDEVCHNAVLGKDAGWTGASSFAEWRSAHY